MTTWPVHRLSARAAVHASVLAGIAAVTAVAALSLAALPANAQATPTPAATPARLPCSVETHMWAWPQIVPAGETTGLTATLKFACPGSETARRHIVFVVDASSSMAGDPRNQLLKAIDEFILQTPLENGRIQVAIVQYTASAEVLCPLTNSRSELESCRALIGASGGSCIDCGVTAAHDELLRAREGVPPGVELSETIVVMTDGANADGCDALTAAAARPKTDRVLVVSVAIGSASDVPCMRTTATSPRYFFEGRQAGQLGNIFYTIRRQLENGKILRLSLRFVPSAGLLIEPDSASWPGEIEPDGSASWLHQMVPTEGVTVMLQLRPTIAGAMPALAVATGEFVDSHDNVAPIEFDIPDIVTLGEGHLPTATPAAASHIRENALALSPPQPKRGERARLDYRFALDDPVDPQGSHVMIVADTSGSMSGEPIVALRAAVRGLVARLPLGDDVSMRVGIVTFTQGAKLLVGLTDSRPALESAISQFSAAGLTCIDCGLRVGLDALAVGRPAPGVEDLIVLTDGANNGGCGPVVEQARAVKAEGILVHAVCFGDGCDTHCMRAVASPGHYHDARTLADLSPTFAAIGDNLLADRRYDAVNVRIALPPHLRFVPGSFNVSPDAGGDAYDQRWTFRPLPFAALELSAEVEAIVDGSRPAVAVSEGIGRDGRVVRWAAEAALEVPTAVETPLSPTPTPVSSTEPTEPTEPTVTAVTPVVPWPGPQLYLPVAMRRP